jgi:hypothetical protein
VRAGRRRLRMLAPMGDGVRIFRAGGLWCLGVVVMGLGSGKDRW